jgi:hypothetical protein
MSMMVKNLAQDTANILPFRHDRGSPTVCTVSRSDDDQPRGTGLREIHLDGGHLSVCKVWPARATCTNREGMSPESDSGTFRRFESSVIYC